MPVESRPLFRSAVLRPRLSRFELPDQVDQARDRLAAWAELLDSPKLEQFTEQELLADFVTDIFYRVLGYSGPPGREGRYTLSREKYVEVEGEFADAVLGRFGGDSEQFVVAVEGKRPSDPLERPFGGRRMSAVDQAYRFAINLPCDWLMVTNLKEIRLYHKGSNQRTYERFEIARLAVDESALRRFVYQLGADRVVPVSGICHFADLLAASERADLEVTKALYREYAEMRRDILDRLRSANPAVLPEIVLFYTQKLLDRVLFCAFCEDRGLLPADTLKRAYEHRDPYNPKPIWATFKGLFDAIDQGNEQLGIPQYNGGLFAADPGLEGLTIPGEVFRHFKRLGEYDYRAASQLDPVEADSHTIDVEILGHIFEQSITHLEQLQAELASDLRDAIPTQVSRRKREGAFYTPAFVTRYIVGQALSGVLANRFDRLRDRLAATAKGTASRVLDDPRVYDLGALNHPQRSALVRFWEAWFAELETVRLLDPACGSGAFLIEAFDQLHATYQETNERLAELRGQRTLFDPDRTILRKNLYGVDVNEEAIEICRLSIWIKTAQRGKRLTDLDHNIRIGNSLVSDPEVDPRSALDWPTAFPEVFADGGFDVVVGNPPYVRQELLGSLKPYLQATFRSYHGMADLYVYFCERGVQLLRPGGRLSFVITNKWMKAAYAEPLRRLFHDDAWMESVVDLGHAKQVFPEADVFPSILVARRPGEGPRPPTTRVCSIPREQLRVDDLAAQVQAQGFEVPRDRLGAKPWTLEPPAVAALMAKLRRVGVPLAEYAGVKPLYGIKSGLNEAFLIDGRTRDELVAADARSAEILKPYLRGQDIRRWSPSWSNLWMILMKSSTDHHWPWSDAGSSAEERFQETYPAVHHHMKRLEGRLRRRQDKGRFWWELRSCSYYDRFDDRKIIYQEIQFLPSFASDVGGRYANNKVFLIPTNSLYLLSILNSPLIWWHNWRYLPHLKDEALNPAGFRMEALPVPVPTDDLRLQVEDKASRLIHMAQEAGESRERILDWLQVEHGVEKPSRALQSLFDLDGDALIAEVRKVRGRKHPLSSAAVRNLREEHAATIEPTRRLIAKAPGLEREISDLVNEAYDLTAEEIDLMWRTAPPRMPFVPRAD